MLRSALLLVWSLAALAAAQGSPQCPSGEILCCSSVLSAAEAVLSLPAEISVSAAADLGLVGSSCTGLTVIGRGKSCATKQTPMCCSNGNYNGSDMSLGCTRINPMLA